MSWWVPLVAILGLIVALVAWLVFTEPRQEEGAMGQHSWLDDRDVDDSGGDVELLAAVTGLGEERGHSREARTAALDLPAERWDLRGGRDVDPETSNPWADEDEAELRQVRVKPVDEREDTW